MKIVYEIYRDLLSENAQGDIENLLQRDRLYSAESFEEAWNKYLELRSAYIFRWTKRSISILRFKRIEV